ncbi:MAG: S8/S53 family peptidase [Chloroflexi bacterium]|nr:S8/S53 family peptidase [Chloroflexota bacterium]
MTSIPSMSSLRSLVASDPPTLRLRSQTGRRAFRTVLPLVSMALLLVASFSTAYAHPSATLVPLSASAVTQPTGAHIGSHYTAPQMTIGLLLATSHQQEQQALIKALYNPHSPLYHQWLKSGAFNARFAPASSQIKAAQDFLTGAHMHLLAGSPSPTLLLASGTVAQVEAALHTTINNYQTPSGQQYFANSSAVQVPANLSGNVIGTLGLTNLGLVRPHSQVSDGQQRPHLPPPYGGGPFGRGLTPSQIAGIYDAAPVYKQLNDKGQGITTAVVEFSGYTPKDIDVYKKQFKLPNVPIIDKPVYGGPTPVNGALDRYASEVELDIELQLAIAPDIKQLLVYNAPNSEIGDVAQYLQIAKDNQADAISTSWGLCEYLATTSIELGEFQALAQMATQGQSIFAASGDSGAFDCLPYTDNNLQGNNELQADDPAAQPYMTAVGGTSFAQPNRTVLFDPGTNANPTYPGVAKEVTWTRGCPPKDCAGGAGGGGVSRFWGSPDYQSSAGQAVPGFIEPGLTQSGAYCGQTAGTFCRELPDVSLNADPSTGYAIYCADKQDPFCTDPTYNIKGWIRLGGTSTSAPLWAGIAALIDHFNRTRQGLLNYYFYSFDSAAGFKSQFHDITSFDNGHYPAGPAYDMATGLGSADIFHLVKP